MSKVKKRLCKKIENEIKEIDNCICKILNYYGPDGHIDGHQIITKFVCWMLLGKKSKQAFNLAIEDENE